MEDNKCSAEVVDRKEGYYWVMYGSDWIICRYLNGKWYDCGYEGEMEDYDFNEIDERQICRS